MLLSKKCECIQVTMIKLWCTMSCYWNCSLQKKGLYPSIFLQEMNLLMLAPLALPLAGDKLARKNLALKICWRLILTFLTNVVHMETMTQV